MKKVYLLIIFILCFLLVLLLSLFLFIRPQEEAVISYKDYSNVILDNSSWVTLDKSDFNSLVLMTYSNKILDIISSLENAIPVIFEVNGGQFCKDNKNNFVVVSAFDTDNTVFAYVKVNDEYEKFNSSLEEILENATRFFIINDEEAVR